MMIPATAIIVTRNEAKRLPACIAALRGFQSIVVVDSASQDATRDVARSLGIPVVDYKWDGKYPKKRQWTLENVPIETSWVFFVDADEIVTPELCEEIGQALAFTTPVRGYFVKGKYRIGNHVLRFGIPNSKLALFRKEYFKFPEVDDLDVPGMGEIEGHYQPVPIEPAPTAVLRNALLHDAMEDQRAWAFRHERYARWEVGMNRKNAWPADPIRWRQATKCLLRQTGYRPELIFLLNYVVKLGFLDGRDGYAFARSRYQYYDMIRTLEKSLPRG